MTAKSCTLDVLRSQAGCSVCLCEHGTVHLTIGSVTLRIGRAALDPLAELLAGAAAAAAARSSAPEDRESMH